MHIIKIWKEKYSVLFGILIALAYIIILRAAGYFVTLTNVSGNDYLKQMIAEIFLVLYGIAAILVLRYDGIFHKSKVSIRKGLISAGYFLVVGFLNVIIQVYESKGQPLSSFFSIIIFFVALVMISIAEEFVFRGVIATALFEQYGKNKKGVWFSVVVAGVLFGSVHLANIFAGAPVFSAVIQMIIASGMGMALVAIYYRTRNIWLLVLVHTVVNVGALFQSGFYQSNDLIYAISNYNLNNLIAIIPVLIVTYVLLRNSKMHFILEDF